MPSGDLDSFRGALGYRLDGGLDTNGDGVLTLKEARPFLKKMAEEDK